LDAHWDLEPRNAEVVGNPGRHFEVHGKWLSPTESAFICVHLWFPFFFLNPTAGFESKGLVPDRYSQRKSAVFNAFSPPGKELAGWSRILPNDFGTTNRPKRA
jgi:hypothetical protein